jgi:glycosyltransferase involved in cell wall biosynthesis
MHVGWVIDGSLDQLSGGYLYDHLVIDHLRRAGVEVRLISLPTGPYAVRLARGLGLRLDRWAAAEAVEVLVQDELSHPALLRANRRVASALPGLPRVGLVHHLRSSEPRNALANALFRQIERAYLASLNAFIFNSSTTRAAVGRLVGSSVPATVAFPGADRLNLVLDPQTIRSRAGSPGPLRVLFLGNQIPRKGLLTLIEAVALLPPGSVQLSVVGSAAAEPRYARRVRRRVDALRLGPRVTFTGSLQGESLQRVLIESQVLAVPSSYEGYGMAYLEGMGCGLPAIAGVEGGAAEFVRDAENGYLVPPGDPAALAERLASLQADRPRLALMGLEAASTYRSHPTWEDTGKLIHRFLMERAEGLSSAPANRSTMLSSSASHTDPKDVEVAT